ncbi:MAG TPA: hypothetical protein VFV23_11110 [Verrucomicrobiae bacterium]|nr:hypothetical protein [Verrucomicrobiae bacterium]
MIAGTVLMSFAAVADVTVSQSASGLSASTPFDSTSPGGGSLLYETSTNLGTSGAVTITVNAGSSATGILQTFQGVDAILEGFAFWSPGVNNPTTGSYTISLLDYGSVGPITTSAQMNGTATTIFSDTFTFPNTLARQYYFDFTDSAVLNSSDYYGILMSFSNAGGSGNINAARTTQDSYSGGAYGTGAAGSTTANSSRDLDFAIYTTPTPEPSTVAMITCGALALWFTRHYRARTK